MKMRANKRINVSDRRLSPYAAIGIMITFLFIIFIHFFSNQIHDDITIIPRNFFCSHRALPDHPCPWSKYFSSFLLLLLNSCRQWNGVTASLELILYLYECVPTVDLLTFLPCSTIYMYMCVFACGKQIYIEFCCQYYIDRMYCQMFIRILYWYAIIWM